MREDLHPFELYALQTFEAERNHPLHDSESLPYSDVELRAIQRMASYIEEYVLNNAMQFSPFVTFETNRTYFSEQVRYYYDLKKQYIEEKRFPEPYFFTTAQAGYEYITLENSDWIIPADDNLDIYSLFFVFKLRTLSIQSIEAFLEYQVLSFPGNFYHFLKVFLFDYSPILNSAHYEILKAWLSNQISPIIEDKKSLTKKDFTQAQIVLTIYYAFKYFGIEIRSNTNIAPVAKFIHLLVGDKFTVSSNSEYYKRLRQVPNFKSDEKLVEDLEIVKNLFMEVKLKEVAEMIENEIITARAERKNSQE